MRTSWKGIAVPLGPGDRERLEAAIGSSGDGQSHRDQSSQRAADLGGARSAAAPLRLFKLSNDLQFAAELPDVVGLYINPPEHALVLSVDEKSQIQALDRTQPGCR